MDMDNQPPHPKGYYQPLLRDLFIGVEYEYFQCSGGKISNPNIGEEFINPYMLDGDWVKCKIEGNPGLIRGFRNLSSIHRWFYRQPVLTVQDFKQAGIKVREISNNVKGTMTIPGFRENNNPLLSEITFNYNHGNNLLRVTCWDGDYYSPVPQAEQLFKGKIYTISHLLSVMHLLFE